MIRFICSFVVDDFLINSSGSMDALAVLESARFRWLGREHHSNTASPPAAGVAQSNRSGVSMHSRDRSSNSSPYLFSGSITVSDAVPIVRRAVRAGILNDLGSGSHVDLCVISCDNVVRRWREQLLSSWEKDKAHEREGVSSVNRDGGSGGNGGMAGVAESISARILPSSMNQNGDNNTMEGNQKHEQCNIARVHGVLGRKVFSRRRLMKFLQGDEVKELQMHSIIENDLSMEVEVL